MLHATELRDYVHEVQHGPHRFLSRRRQSSLTSPNSLLQQELLHATPPGLEWNVGSVGGWMSSRLCRMRGKQPEADRCHPPGRSDFVVVKKETSTFRL